jgi:hypothetical protein
MEVLARGAAAAATCPAAAQALGNRCNDIALTRRHRRKRIVDNQIMAGLTKF